MSVLGSVKLRISMFCSVIPGRILIFGRIFALRKALRANAAVSHCPQPKALKMRSVHVKPGLLFSSHFHSRTGLVGIYFVCQGKIIFSACPQNTNQIMAAVETRYTFADVPRQVTPSVSARCLGRRRFPASSGQVCLEFHGETLPEGRDLMMLVR